MLSYVVDSTAAPICVLIPLSTWAVFYAGLFTEIGFAESGEGMVVYISAIPYMLYPMVAVVMVPFVATGRIPALGLMKQAQKRAEAGLISAAPGDIEIYAAEDNENSVKMYHFVLPILTLLIFSLWGDPWNPDVQLGVIAAVALTMVLFGAQKLLPWTEMFDAVLDGIKIMLPALTIVIVAFVFKDVNDQLGLANYVIDNVAHSMTPVLLPLIVFVTMSFISFATGSSWGVFTIAIPVILPLAESLGVSIPLAIGAIVSASAFGSHACFYSDSTVLAAQGCGCDVMDHALTQIPYALIAACIAGLGLTLLAAL
jgi:tetracycline resistance efflux pump